MIPKPTPDELARLREQFPRGAPRFAWREVAFARAAADGDDAATGAASDPNALIPITISSEAPVLRYDWWEGEQYYEVLDHAASSVDMSYATDGLPFIMSHQAYDGDQQHGIVLNVAIDAKTRTLGGDVLMSRAQRSQDIRQDMLDGIRRKISVGYVVGDDFTQEKGGADGIPTRRYTAWMPIEASTVPIPADYSVGVDRAQTPQLREQAARFLALHPVPAGQRTAPAADVPSAPPVVDPPAPDAVPAPAPAPSPESARAEDPPMTPPTETPTGSAPALAVVDRSTELEASRIERLRELAATHAMSERMPAWLRERTSVEDAQTETMRAIAERLAKPTPVTEGVKIPVKDQRRYSYARALILSHGELTQEMRGGRVDFGLETEVLTELRKTNDQRGGGSIIPFSLGGDLGKRAGIDSATGTTGGVFKFTQAGPFIDMLRNKMSVSRAGATFLSGLTGPVSFPKQKGAATATWIGENPGSNTTLSNLITGTVSLALKTVMAPTTVSRQALISAASGNYDLDRIIQSDLAMVIALAADLAGLVGGLSNGPTGVLSNTGINTTVTLGTNGGTVGWNPIVDLETAIGDANADGPTLAYITNTAQRGRMKKASVLGATGSPVPIWSNVPGEMDGQVNGYRALATNQMPRNLTKGTSTTVCSGIAFGAWEHVIVGQFGGGFEALVDPYSLAGQGMIAITTWSFMDIAIRYPEAFAAILDAL